MKKSKDVLGFSPEEMKYIIRAIIEAGLVGPGKVKRKG